MTISYNIFFQSFLFFFSLQVLSLTSDCIFKKSEFKSLLQLIFISIPQINVSKLASRKFSFGLNLIIEKKITVGKK